MRSAFSILFVVVTSWCTAQTVNGPYPPNFRNKVPNTARFYSAPKVNNAAEKFAADQINRDTHDKMLRFGKELAVDIDFRSVADRFDMPNGRSVYQYGIRSKNAVSINLILENFYLAEGAYLFLTDPVTERFIGAYTSSNNNDANVLGTELLHSDEIVVVLEEPTQVATPSQFTIKTIVHGFNDLTTIAKGLNTSGNCHYDVNCPIGTGYELQRNSVAMIVSGGYLCSGSLVNNTSGNIIPYFLTARHCGTNPSSWVFRFRWEAPYGQTSCADNSSSGNGIETYNVNGSVLRAMNGTSDFILTELNSNPDPAWGVYYNGWDNTDINPEIGGGIGIHHPKGDIKKISIENDPLNQMEIQFNGADNRVWRVRDWEYGVTENGSSGSPLFNKEKRVIGVLSGGDSKCLGTNDNGLADYYGRFGYAWDNSPNADGRLKDWLDPVGKNPTVIDGVDPAIGYDSIDASIVSLQGIPQSRCEEVGNFSFKLVNSGLDTLTEVVLAYGFNNAFNQNYTWNGNLKTYEWNNIALPSINIPNGENTFSVKIVSSNGGVDTNVSNNLLEHRLVRLDSSFTAKLVLKLDCAPFETSWEIVDESGNVLYYSPVYDKDTPKLNEYSFCLEDGCYAMIIRDYYNDGLSGCSDDQGGDGSYIITNQNTGTTLAEIPENQANFGTINKQVFCVGVPNSVEEISLENSIRLFPNPGTNGLNITTDGLLIESVQVYSLTGQEIHTVDVGDTHEYLTTSNWPEAFYLIKINTKKGSLVRRWIKN